MRPSPVSRKIAKFCPWRDDAGLLPGGPPGDPFALAACLLNGRPAAVIVATHDDGTYTHFMPLFVAVQEGMSIKPHPDLFEDQPA